MQNIDKRILSAALVLLVVFLGAESLLTLKKLSEPSANAHTIVVTGEGEAFATPDVATFNFTVSADAKTVGEAQDTVTTKVNSILDALKNLGIADKDIRTTDYSVYPKYTYQPTVCTTNYCPPSRQVPDGYTVSHSVTVKVRQTADAGQALAVAGARGATNISSLTFTVDDPDQLTATARDQAVQKAYAKAKALAKSLGVHLGRVVDFNESSASPWIYPMTLKSDVGMGGSEATAPNIPTGQNKITSNVTITYEIR